MPVEAKLLSIGVQEERLVFWALVDMDKPMIYRMFRLFWTGEKFESPLQGYYFGSAKIGYLVWHVFDMGEKP